MKFLRLKIRFHLPCAALLLLTLALFSACTTTTPPPPQNLRDVTTSVDYSRRDNWIILPDADSAPHEVDVFYVYPTIVAHNDHPYMDWSDPAVQKKAHDIAAQQTGAFANVGMIYAPYYRQGEYFRVIKEAAKKPEEQRYTQLGLEDIRAAFRQPGGKGLGQLARILAGFLGQQHGHIDGQIPVTGVAGRLDDGLHRPGEPHFLHHAHESGTQHFDSTHEKTPAARARC